MTLKTIVLIFLGGGLGSILRFIISKFLNNSFPYGTLIANLVGCLAIGLAIGLFHKCLINKELYFFLAVGICGGFTTFSTFSLESLEFLKQEKWCSFFGYTSISFIVGLLMIYFGQKISHYFF